MKRSTIFTLLAAVAFGALLLYSTLSSQRIECTVTIDFNGRTNTATASGATEAEATKQAQSTACGPVASGMNESIACGNIVPVKKACRTL
jgi:hypothetical protein